MPENPATPEAEGTTATTPAPVTEGSDAASFSEAAKNAAAKKARLEGQGEGRKALLRELAEQTGFQSLEDLVSAAKQAAPEAQATKASAKAKQEEERQKLVSENEVLRKTLEGEIVKNTVYPIMASLNVRKPQLALTDIRETTKHDIVLKEGRDGVKVPTVVDSDGDEVTTDVNKWLSEQFKQEAFTMHVKPTIAPPKSSGKQGGNGSEKPNPNAPPTTFFDSMRSKLAAAQSGQDDE